MKTRLHFVAILCAMALAIAGAFAEGSFPGTGTRLPLQAATTFFANASTGADTNPCTAALQCQTGQRLIGLANTIDTQGFALGLQLADGNYPSGIVCNGPFIGGGIVTLLGNLTTPTNVVLNNGGIGTAVQVQNGCQLAVQGMRLKGNNDLAQSINFASVTLASIDFPATSGGSHIAARHHGFAQVTGPISISGGAAAHMLFANNAAAVEQNQTITFTASVVWSTAYAVGQYAASGKISGNNFVMGANTATGAHWSVDGNAILLTNGQCNNLPGSTAGVSTNQGICY